MERIEIPASAGAKIFAVCAIAMTALSVLVMFTVPGFAGFVAFLGVLFFGLCTYMLLPVLSKGRRPVLVVDDEGVTDHTPLLGVGLIPWSDIRGVAVGQSSGRNYLLLTVPDPSAYLLSSGIVRRTIAKLHRFPPCLPIDLGSLEADAGAVVEAIGQEAARRVGEGGGPAPIAPSTAEEAVAQPAGAAAAATDVPEAPAQPAAASPSDDAAALEKLAELRDKGILTEEEFTQKKKDILGI